MITAIGDADPARWPGSKWRLLKEVSGFHSFSMIFVKI